MANEKFKIEKTKMEAWKRGEKNCEYKSRETGERGDNSKKMHIPEDREDGKYPVVLQRLSKSFSEKELWSKITGQVATQPSLSLRTLGVEGKTKEKGEQSQREGAERKREKHNEVMYGS